jgi:ABC-type molybdenum transport system ATPase subunit/photorepair protein PhrA
MPIACQLPPKTGAGVIVTKCVFNHTIQDKGIKCVSLYGNIANQWLNLLGMKDRADDPFNRQSYGDQRLLLIARAMVKHPPLLILDEPCLGLDEMNRHRVLSLIEIICTRSVLSHRVCFCRMSITAIRSAAIRLLG